jgi:uncharacterized membrane protein HdeD (DUF308 family)
MYSEVNLEEKKSSKKSRLFHRRTKRLLTSTRKDISLFFNVFLCFSIMLVFYGVLAVLGAFNNATLKNILGLMFLLYSIIHFYFYQYHKSLAFYKSSVVTGMTGLVLAMIVWFTDSFNCARILVFFGLFLFLVLLERVLQGIKLLQSHDKDVLVFGVMQVLLILMAILLFINPFVNLYFGEVLGIFSILFGILNFSSLSFLKKKEEVIMSFYD